MTRPRRGRREAWPGCRDRPSAVNWSRLFLAALRSGAGHVMAICGSQAEARNLRLTAELNGRADAFEALPLPYEQLRRIGAKMWTDSFSLIVVSLSPHLFVRHVRDLTAWLAPTPSRLIVTGPSVGPQTSLTLKAALRAGLTLVGSAVEGGWTALRLARRRPGGQIWRWRPGDWLSDLNEDDQAYLAEAERKAQRKGPAKGYGVADTDLEDAAAGEAGAEGAEGADEPTEIDGAAEFELEDESEEAETEQAETDVAESEEVESEAAESEEAESEAAEQAKTKADAAGDS